MQIFQKYFKNIQLLSMNPIKCINIYADSCATNFIKTSTNSIQYVNGEC